MPASCTLRLNRLSTNSNESPGFTKISVMRITSATGARSSDQYAAIGNNHCNTPVCRLAAEKAPGPPYHNWRRWRYTSGVVRDLDSPRYAHHRYIRRQTAYAQRGIPGSGLAHWSAPGLHKTPARQR